MTNVKNQLNKGNKKFIDNNFNNDHCSHLLYQQMTFQSGCQKKSSCQKSRQASNQAKNTNSIKQRSWQTIASSVFRHSARFLVVLLMGASSAHLHAAILSDSSDRRIEVRYGSANNPNADTSYPYITPATNKGDRLQGLIEQKQREYPFVATPSIGGELSIEENKRIDTASRRPYNNSYNGYPAAISMDYQMWLNSNSYRAQQVANYQRYLSAQLGAHNVPPLDQLLTTARSWERCGYEPYQLPPQELWSNIVPTLRLYSILKSQGVLPPSTEIRSVYRSPDLNDCAGGASGSKHMTAGAMDIWVPEYGDNEWRISNLQNNLCEFWQYQGSRYEFGLGLYSTGAIHLDTQGYRKWGVNYANSSSSCRY